MERGLKARNIAPSDGWWDFRAQTAQTFMETLLENEFSEYHTDLRSKARVAVEAADALIMELIETSPEHLEAVNGADEI